MSALKFQYCFALLKCSKDFNHFKNDLDKTLDPSSTYTKDNLVEKLLSFKLISSSFQDV